MLEDIKLPAVLIVIAIIIGIFINRAIYNALAHKAGYDEEIIGFWESLERFTYVSISFYFAMAISIGFLFLYPGFYNKGMSTTAVYILHFVVALASMVAIQTVGSFITINVFIRGASAIMDKANNHKKKRMKAKGGQNQNLADRFNNDK